MAKIYVASSWRNEQQAEVVRALREAGHEVYDFKNPAPGESGFSWREVDPNWSKWSPAQYRDALEHPISQHGLGRDLAGMVWCDLVIGVQPFGRSASFEVGWGVGNGKRVAVLLAPGEPELMFALAHKLCLSLDEVVEWAGRQ